MAKATTVQLAPGVWRIPLIGDWVNGFIFRDDDGQVTLVDTGVNSSGPKVIAALRSIGSGPSDVTRLLLTHCHPDHAGGAAYVSRETGRSVDIHAEDADFVRTGTQPDPDPASTIGKLFRKLPDPKTEAVTVGEELTDGQVLDVAGELEVVHTPGHSPGHASFLHRDSGVLITGDAIFNVLGVRWSPRIVCSNIAMSRKTAHRLAELEYSTAAFTHGPELTENPREAIRRFLAKKG